MVTRGVEGTGVPTVVATVRPIGAEGLRQRREGVRAITLARGTDADTFADAPWLLGGVKSLSYALNMAALREAVAPRRRGRDLGRPRRHGARSADRDRGLGPRAAAGHHAGRRRAESWPARRWPPCSTGPARTVMTSRSDTIGAADLAAADGIWLVSAIRGVAEVTELDGTAASGPARTDRAPQRLRRFLTPAHLCAKNAVSEL